MIHVWTDGACSGAPGIGGWAWVRDTGQHSWGHEPSTTNQRMEMMAVLEALRANPDGPITVYSDSAYVINCFQSRWYIGWQRNGWQNSQKKPVANRDLWEALIPLATDPRVRFVKVKGHSDDEMNDVVDKLAVAAKFQEVPE